jgi:hypothetical protein
MINNLTLSFFIFFLTFKILLTIYIIILVIDDAQDI